MRRARLCPHPLETARGVENATVGGALVPMLALGVSGPPTTAIIMGALIMHGLHPGPQFLAEQPALVQSILFGVILAALVQYVVGALFLPVLARMATTQSSWPVRSACCS
ncbi:tripartite tricarboxylate transporter permease [Frigidibacter sp. MR17.24]|uniref:tripartite tricarboxylate transporter permease n=1 Tax=Frigidibacter sp. MR17.24 TaxID=3127345 RepID=UPI003012BC59